MSQKLGPMQRHSSSLNYGYILCPQRGSLIKDVPNVIHIGIIGGGNISDTHARAAREIEGVEISAIYGLNQEKSTELGRRYGGVVYPDFETLLQHKPMDLAAIGSPSGLHAEQGIAAARRGLHVLVEKPIDIDVDRTDQLIEACDIAGVKLGVF